MNRFVLSSLAIVASIAYACGPRARSAETEQEKAVDGPPIAAALDVKASNGFQFSFRVTNNEPRKIELLFPSGQTHDFVVIDSLGREVWRWSEGRMFTQVVQNKVLESRASLTWDATWRPDVPPGRYTAVASLLSENKPLEERIAFDVR